MSVEIAVAHGTSPFISVYPWSSGFGTKYTDPGTLPTGAGNGLAFSPSKNALAVAHTTSPFISVYPWSSGFGTKYTDPGTLPNNLGRCVAFSPSGDAIAVGNQTTSPSIAAYPWAPGFGTKYANPSTLPETSSYGVAFSPSGDTIGVAHGLSPYVSLYPWSSGFGTKYTDPGTLPAGVCSEIRFSPTGEAVAVSSNSSPFILVYPWSSGFGTKYTDPGTLPASTSGGLAFSPSGADIAVAHSTSPFISVYPWSSGFGTKYTDPGTLPANASTNVGFSPAGDAVAVSTANTSPYVAAYPWSSGFGAKYGNPGTLPAGSGTDVVFSPATPVSRIFALQVEVAEPIVAVSRTFSIPVEAVPSEELVSQTFSIRTEATQAGMSRAFPLPVEAGDSLLYGTAVAVHCVHGDSLEVDHDVSGGRIVFKDAKAIDAPAGDVTFDSMKIPEPGEPPVYSRVKNFRVTLPVKSGTTWDNPTMHFEARHRSWSGVRMFVTKSDAPVSTGPSVDGQPVDPLPGFVDNIGRYTASNPITLQPTEISQASLVRSEQFTQSNAYCYRVEFDDEFVYELIKAPGTMFIRRLSKADLSVSAVSAALSLPSPNDVYVTTHLVNGFLFVFGGDQLGGSVVVSKVSCSTLTEVGVLELNEAQYNGYVTSDGEYLYTIGFDYGAYESIITKISLSEFVQGDTLTVSVGINEDDTSNYGLAVSDGKLYAGTGSYLYAIDKETMTVLQKSATFYNSCGLLQKIGDYIYTTARGGFNGSVHKLAAQDLSLVDSVSFPNWAMNETLFLEEAGHLLFYDSEFDGKLLRAVNLETMEAYGIPHGAGVEVGYSQRMAYDPSHGLWLTSVVTSPSWDVRLALVDLDIHSKPLASGPAEFWVQVQASVSSEVQPGYPRDFALVVRVNEVGTSEVVWE